MTLVRDQKKYGLYYDNVLASNSDSKGVVIRLGHYVYFGGAEGAGATGA